MSKKVLSMVLGLAVCLCLSVSAFAEVKTFENVNLKIDVPTGWTATQAGEGVLLVADDMSASIVLGVTKAAGKKVEDIAKETAAQLKASAPVAEEGGYSFTFTADGSDKPTNVFVVGEGDQVAVISITGDNPAIEGIITSIAEIE